VLLVIGSIRLPPANLVAARPVMERMIHASRQEDGCLAYAYAQDVLEPGLIRITEMWRDRQCLQHHLASAHIAEWRSAWALLGIGERQLQLYEASGGQST
jgi:quinol monooxygenase YgiN